VLKTENFFPLFPRKTKNEKLNFVLLIRKPTGKTFVPTDRLKKQSDLCFDQFCDFRSTTTTTASS
jgi:hypothetical protein